MDRVRVAVAGAGQFGRHHMRVIRDSARAELVAVVDPDTARASEAARQYSCPAFNRIEDLHGKIDAAIVAAPTNAHAEIGCAFLEAGVDVLVEKPIAADLGAANRLVETARRAGRILQVGHLERFNPAVIALERAITLPLFFEIHRLSVFTPRSLDVDVVLDLMIHDIDIVLSLVGRRPEEIRAAGISILSPKVDIANARLAFPGGCIANLTASRVSTEQVRKLRLFQPEQYISVDYKRQDGVVISVQDGMRFGMSALPVQKDEPLRLELESFFECVAQRAQPVVDGNAACLALEVALGILDKIKEHSLVVAQSLAALRKP